jgi:catechol 2,3-dioxygenase-like lactoylglutathione lyase family enzyme
MKTKLSCLAWAVCAATGRAGITAAPADMTASTKSAAPLNIPIKGIARNGKPGERADILILDSWALTSALSSMYHRVVQRRKKERVMGKDTWVMMHVGVVVRNMDQAVAYFKSLGLVSSESPEIILDSESGGFGDNLLTLGKKHGSKWKIKIKMVNIGPLTLELTEPLEGDNVNGQYLKTIGEGANHIAYAVDDLEQEHEEMVKKGIPAIYYAKDEFAYYDTRKSGNLIIEFRPKSALGPPTG